MKKILHIICILIIASNVYAGQLECLTSKQVVETYNTLQRGSVSQLIIWCSCCNGGRDAKLKISNCSYSVEQNGGCYFIVVSGYLPNGNMYKNRIDLLNTYIKVGNNAFSLAVVLHYNTAQISSCKSDFVWDENTTPKPATNQENQNYQNQQQRITGNYQTNSLNGQQNNSNNTLIQDYQRGTVTPTQTNTQPNQASLYAINMANRTVKFLNDNSVREILLAHCYNGNVIREDYYLNCSFKSENGKVKLTYATQNNPLSGNRAALPNELDMSKTFVKTNNNKAKCLGVIMGYNVKPCVDEFEWQEVNQPHIDNNIQRSGTTTSNYNAINSSTSINNTLPNGTSPNNSNNIRSSNALLIIGGANEPGYVMNGQWTGNIDACKPKSNKYEGDYVINTNNSSDAYNYWSITASDFSFGNLQGSGIVTLTSTNISLRILSWSNYLIKVQPIARFTLQSEKNIIISVKNSNNQICSKTISVIGMIGNGRGYGQCTWEVGYQRMMMNKTIPPNAYTKTDNINSGYIPQVGDVLYWNNSHTGIITSVPRQTFVYNKIENGRMFSKIITYTFDFTERNFNCQEYSTNYLNSFIVGETQQGEKIILQGVSSKAYAFSSTAYWR